MPRYYFHIREGSVLIPDDEGLNLTDAESAMREARESARDFVVDALMMRRAVGDQKIEVADNLGHVIGTLKIADVLG